jgi:hypothetical protein
VGPQSKLVFKSKYFNIFKNVSKSPLSDGFNPVFLFEKAVDGFCSELTADEDASIKSA